MSVPIDATPPSNVASDARLAAISSVSAAGSADATMPIAAPWLGACVPALAQRIVHRALLDVGLVELPPGSNRSPHIDAYLAAVGSPLASPWCAAALAAWWREAGAAIPPADAGSCEAWRRWAESTGSWRDTPAIGDAVLYGSPGGAGAAVPAEHAGVVVRVVPLVLSVEGNTTLAGGVTHDGIATALKQVDPHRVLGYVAPRPP